MLDFIFSAQFITGMFVGANFAMLAFALCAMSKKSARMDKDFEEWIKTMPRG